MITEIPDDHPRAESLRIRHAIIDGMHKDIVAEAGLIAHGRGEAFDYLIGEKTHDFARKAINAAAASLYLADHPIISVNGNTSVLCPTEMIQFSQETNIPLEVNLFYRNDKRMKAIKNLFRELNFEELLGFDENYRASIPELTSQRRIVDKRGIIKADVVLIPLEDGDRTESLVKLNKKVIAIDLNPLSRTSQSANITIVDNVIRVFPKLLDAFRKMNSKIDAREIIDKYDNQSNLSLALSTISSYLNHTTNL